MKARLVVAGSLAAYFGLLEVLGGRSAWPRLGIPIGTKSFSDLRDVTSAWDCVRRGVHVLPANPCDPYNRLFDYPRLWLLPSHLGLGQRNTAAIGLVIVAAFLVTAIAVVPANASLSTGVFYAAALCSPAAMLGVERGNPDLLVFVLVAWAALLAHRSFRAGIGGALGLLAASALKLFPVFAVGAFAHRGSRRALTLATGVVAGFGVYAIALRHQLRQVVAAVQQVDYFSFGVRRVSEWASVVASETVSPRLSSYRAWDVLLVLLCLVVAWLLARRLPAEVRVAGHSRNLDLFWAGAGIYVVSYAIARNYDYRLVFLLLTVPQLSAWGAAGFKHAYVSIALIFVVTWLDVWAHVDGLGHALDWWERVTSVGPAAQPLPVAVVAQYALFASLAMWLVATVPHLRR